MDTKRMDKDTVRQEIRNFIVETFLFGADASMLEDSDSFMQNGVVDSTGILEVTGFIEEKYSIQIENEEMTPANLDSVDNLVNFIARKSN
ncbi:MAG TPA: acyl carrier protein [candidate division Zixibacteria bacterium]|nr:acyl carrier protein [candidate division Zixibacteria bacterium]